MCGARGAAAWTVGLRRVGRSPAGDGRLTMTLAEACFGRKRRCETSRSLRQFEVGFGKINPFFRGVVQ
jgi:hypothetical protein